MDNAAKPNVIVRVQTQMDLQNTEQGMTRDRVYEMIRKVIGRS